MIKSPSLIRFLKIQEPIIILPKETLLWHDLKNLFAIIHFSILLQFKSLLILLIIFTASVSFSIIFYLIVF